MSFQKLPTDLQDVVCKYAYGIPYYRLQSDVELCSMIQESIPPSFLVAVCFHKLKWGHVNCPFRKGNAYYPSFHLDMSNPWNCVLAAFITMLHKERVRELRTYKGIIARRAGDLYTSMFSKWNKMFTYLKRLKPCHFRHNAQRSFVREVLAEIAEASFLPT